MKMEMRANEDEITRGYACHTLDLVLKFMASSSS